MTSLKSVFNSFDEVYVIDKSIHYHQYVPLDLSENNQILSKINLENANDFEDFIEKYVTKNNAAIAFGGYNEVRNLYKRSTIFNENDKTERNIHIGLDIWTKAGTLVLAALDGIIHSYQNNTGLGNYGPTIILQHHFDECIFYTLYGHLSEESIAKLKIGTEFKKGQILATLGDATVNGDYAPHLHFQIIKDIGNYYGDYPGVCSSTDLHYFLVNCPDPNLLLKIK